ncbi:MAG: hypothetical protein QG610_63 [Euryarchaeota archaeon]|nr:hypothetical protein [Euryarchaeota archaeon]
MYGDRFPEKGHVARGTILQGTSAALDNILALTLKAHQRIKSSNYNSGSVNQNRKTTALMSTFLTEINHIPFKLFGGLIIYIE